MSFYFDSNSFTNKQYTRTELPYSDLKSLPARTSNYDFAERTIGIVGGGFCGTLAVITILNELTKLSPLTSQVTIRWFDSNNRFCQGEPYQKNSEIFLLNQPACLMSPYKDEPNHYANWVEQHGYGDMYTFTSRNLYGEYLYDELVRHLIKAKKHSISINYISEEISKTSFEYSDDYFIAIPKKKIIPSPCNGMIFVAGHMHIERCPHLRGYPGYYSNPLVIQGDLCTSSSDSIALLIGGGASSVDAIRALDGANFKGRYKIISEHGWELWPYDPSHYCTSRTTYEPKVLNTKCFQQGPTFLKLKNLLKIELTNAFQNGYREGDVYYGISISSLFDNHPVYQEATEFVRYLNYLRGAIIAPENDRLLTELKSNGRIQVLSHRVKTDNIYFDGAKFQIPIHDTDFKIADIVVNCACYARSGIEHPLLQSLYEEKLLDINEFGLFFPSDDFSESVAIAGPYSRSRNQQITDSWGVESFRSDVQSETIKILNYVLNKGK